MRTALLISFFLCLYFHFKSRESGVILQDKLSTQQASSVKSKAKSKTIDLPSKKHPASQVKSEEVKKNEVDQIYNEAEYPIGSDDEDLSQVPWDEIEEGWKTQLKEFLASVEPEKAEEMFTAYLEEKKKYVERIDFAGQENSSEEAQFEREQSDGETERHHLRNLQEIFGEHFTQIQSLHQEYVDSVQYLNRSSVKFSISL